MRRFSFFVARWAAVLLLLPAIIGVVRAGGYDPLVVDATFHPAPLDLTAHDAARDRDIPLRVYLPAATAAAPVVLFSHCLLYTSPSPRD